MTTSSIGTTTRAGTAPSPRRGRLAIALQEMFTAIVRLRADRQVAADAESFRRHVRQVIAMSEQEARQLGYSDEHIRFALYAVVTFLDESVLNSPRPMFAEWPRRPLQEELYGGHLGGEIFFEYLTQLLANPDSEDLADVLEVFQLCILLGFSGRYGTTNGGELHRMTTLVSEKIRRVRGEPGELAPEWRPSERDIPALGGDPWLHRLSRAAIGAGGVVALLFVFYRIMLSFATSGLHDVSSPLAQ
jgi:type VI secretion system protein ImpK